MNDYPSRGSGGEASLRAPIRVYLDSSDYSVLSDPRSAAISQGFRRELLAFAQSGLVEFFFSGAILSEMAPLQASSTSLAAQRAEVVVELCGRNCFVSFENLIRAELKRAITRSADIDLPISRLGDWFPEVEDFISPLKIADLARDIDAEVKSRGVNREQRRRVKRGLFKKGQAKPLLKQWMQNQPDTTDYETILRLYPMRKQDAEVIGSYVLGRATKEQAHDAFLESLRDPRWMMQWFAANADKLTPVTEWLRGPAQKTLASIKRFAEIARTLRDLETRLGTSYRSSLLTQVGWAEQQNLLLSGLSNDLAKSFLGNSAVELSTSDIDVYCPGLSSTVRALHSSFWDAVTPEPRTPRDSDFVDCIHALYAPYTHIFRADRYMAPHIKLQVERHGCVVVPKLSDLVAAIRRKLSA